jgi:hypothetical protein
MNASPAMASGLERINVALVIIAGANRLLSVKPSILSLETNCMQAMNHEIV